MSPADNSCVDLKDLITVHELARSLNSSLNPDEILRTIMAHMERLICTDLWSLLVVNESRSELSYALVSGGREAQLRDLRVKMGEGIAGWVAQHGETLIIPSTLDDPRAGAEQRTGRVHSAIALPLRGRKGVQGVIEILNPHTQELTDYTIALLHILADHAAIAIENARHVEHIRRLTITDDATGLYNARHLYAVLEAELERCTAMRAPLSLAFLDLDHFKLVNDSHGHLVGSELLAATGDRLGKLSRPQDLCFRYGGDEFVLLMPETSLQDAAQNLRRILHEITSRPFVMKSGISLHVGASVGVAASPNDGSSMHAILSSADSRMYRVKCDGRGQVLAE